MRLRIATCRTLPEIDVDAAPLAEAFARAGIEAPLVAWDDPAADWTSPIPTLLRSTWNYAHAVDDYLAWIDRVSAVAPLWNPPEIVNGNVHKRYLLELAARGVPVIPTTLVEWGKVDLPEQPARFVIKPEVGAGSLNARVFSCSERAAALAHLATITLRGAALVQPYVASVEDYGERSLVWIDGELSHAIRKAPRFGGDSEQITGPFPIADDERAVAEAALALPLVPGSSSTSVASQILYGRVDLVRGADGQPMIMELELVEPSLFLARKPGAADRFVARLARELRQLGA